MASYLYSIQRAAGNLADGLSGFVRRNPGTSAAIGAAAIVGVAAGAIAYARPSTPSSSDAGSLAGRAVAATDVTPPAAPVRDPAPSPSPRAPGVRISGSLFRGALDRRPAASSAVPPMTVLGFMHRMDPVNIFTSHGDDLPGLDHHAKNMFKNSYRLLTSLSDSLSTSENILAILRTCGTDGHFSVERILDKVSERTAFARDTIHTRLNTDQARTALKKAFTEELDSWSFDRFGIRSEEIDHQVYELLPNQDKRSIPFAGRDARHTGLSRYFEALGLVIQRPRGCSLPTRTSFLPLTPSPRLVLDGLDGELADKGTRMQTALPELHRLFEGISSLGAMNPNRASNRDIHTLLDAAQVSMGGFSLKQKVLERVAQKLDISTALAQWVVAFPENIGILTWAVGDAVDEWLSTEIGVTADQFHEADRQIYDTISATIRAPRHDAVREMMEESMQNDPLWAQNNRRSPFFSISAFFSMILSILTGGRR